MTTFSYTVALYVKSEDVLAPVINAVFLPVLLLSGILLPMSLAPEWLQWVAGDQPIQPCGRSDAGAVRGQRRQLDGGVGVGLMLVLTAVSLFFAGRVFSQSQS